MEMRKAVEDLQPGPARTECTALLDEAFASLREETEAQRQLHGQVEAAKLLDAETAHAEWPWAEGLPAWRSRLAALHQSVDHPPVWLADQAKALADLLAGIDARLAGMAEDDEALAACEGYLASLETGNPGEADARAGWQALAKPRHAQARQELEHRWKSLSAALYPPPAPSRPAIKAGPAPHAADKLDKETLRALFDQLEQAIAGGHLAEGDGFARQIRNLIGGRKLDGSMETRWHALQGELERLRGWARWGTGQAREKLIADAEALLSGEHPAEELAVAVSALREEWKRLDAHAPAAKAQWESFDATLEKAYAPVAALRAEQAARREAARAAKEALCAQWEADESWREADCKTIEARRADLIRQWRAAPQAGYRDERALRKRFDPLIEAMDRHLDAARAEETARREQIILAAEALAGESDLRRAIAEAKVLQQGWNVSGTTVHLRRGDEQALWRRFRAACDAVFGRLDAERADQAARLAAQEAQRQQHLDEFAAVLAGNSDAQRVRQAMTRFQAAWDGTRPSGRERTNAPSAAQENQARALLNQARQRLDSLRQARQEARYDVLARKAALAAQVEAAVLAGQPAETALAEARQAWAALADSPAKSEKLLAERLDQAGAISAEALAAGQETREALLLDLEIALGLPSPDSVSERRRERQLARLQNRFASAPDGTADPEELVARWYATPAPNDPLAERRIASVVRHLATGSGPA